MLHESAGWMSIHPGCIDIAHRHVLQMFFGINDVQLPRTHCCFHCARRPILLLCLVSPVR